MLGGFWTLSFTIPDKVQGPYPEENFTAQSLLLYGYEAVKELNESSRFSLVVVFFWSQTFLIWFS